MKYGKRRIVEECEVVTERSPGSRLAAVYAAQGTKPLFGFTRCNGVRAALCLPMPPVPARRMRAPSGDQPEDHVPLLQRFERLS
jgi:hypothetical protein